MMSSQWFGKLKQKSEVGFRSFCLSHRVEWDGFCIGFFNTFGPMILFYQRSNVIFVGRIYWKVLNDNVFWSPLCPVVFRRVYVLRYPMITMVSYDVSTSKPFTIYFILSIYFKNFNIEYIVKAPCWGPCKTSITLQGNNGIVDVDRSEALICL